MERDGSFSKGTLAYFQASTGTARSTRAPEDVGAPRPPDTFRPTGVPDTGSCLVARRTRATSCKYHRRAFDGSRRVTTAYEGDGPCDLMIELPVVPDSCRHGFKFASLLNPSRVPNLKLS